VDEDAATPSSRSSHASDQRSNGGGGLITDGDTQWMTAGAELPI
jgi:hypothetical protein